MGKRTYSLLLGGFVLAWCCAVVLPSAKASPDQPTPPSADITPTNAPPASIDVYEAMKEIVNMQREMEEAFNNHSELYARDDILLKFDIFKQLVIKAGVPAAYLEQQPRYSEVVVVVGGSWMDIDLNEMFCWSPGNPYGGYFTNPNNLHGPYGVLRQSYDYLMNNREWYLERPPVEEMAYLRHGMNEWRRHILAYHKTLLESLEVYASFLTYHGYWPRIYQERLAALEERYRGRDRDQLANVAYHQELNALNAWYEGIKRDGEAIRNQLAPAKANVMRFSNALKIDDLGARFGRRIELKRLNDEYLQLEAALKDKNLKGPKRKEMKKRLDQVRQAIEANIAGQQEAFGEGWRDYFRDPATARLPGGMINEKRGARYSERRGQPVEEERIDLNKEDPLVKERDARREAEARPPVGEPVESVIDELTPSEEVAREERARQLQAIQEGRMEEPQEWERRAAAGMEAALHAETPEELAQRYLENMKFQEDMTADESARAQRADEALAAQNQRAAEIRAQHEAEQARLREDIATLERARSPEALDQERTELRDTIMRNARELADPFIQETFADEQFENKVTDVAKWGLASTKMMRETSPAAFSAIRDRLAAGAQLGVISDYEATHADELATNPNKQKVLIDLRYRARMRALAAEQTLRDTHYLVVAGSAIDLNPVTGQAYRALPKGANH